MAQAQAILAKALLASALAVAAAASDDDLTVVKRAVSQRAPMQEAGRPPAGEKPQWLKVRVVEKASRHSRVSVNVPLALVRLLGETCPVIDWHCRAEGGRCAVRVADVLRALESGERQLVEVDSDDALVRVWVE
jgi:hypothetical protein